MKKSISLSFVLEWKKKSTKELKIWDSVDFRSFFLSVFCVVCLCCFSSFHLLVFGVLIVFCKFQVTQISSQCQLILFWNQGVTNHRVEAYWLESTLWCLTWKSLFISPLVLCEVALTVFFSWAPFIFLSDFALRF